jgi:drug/metabolite transporter (DMT)-like permease
MPFIQTILLILAVTSVAIADAFLKQSQALGSLSKALMSPWVIAAVLLYLFQIVVFVYLFVSGARLSNIGITQTVLYALIVLIAAALFFKESFTLIQILGIILALIGVALLDL